MPLESSIMLLEYIYSTGVTHDDNHMMIVICLYNFHGFNPADTGSRG
jgi:hypothetical protein